MELSLRTDGPATSVFFSKKRFFTHGFTFVEILLVVVLLAIIAGIAVPNFSSAYQNLQLKKTTEDLVFMMRYAQSRAVSKNILMRLVLDSDSAQYWLEEQISEKEKDNTSLEEGFQKFEGRLGRTFHIPTDFQVQAEEEMTQFYPDGRIDRQRIYLCHKERCLTISTREQRGAVHIFNEKVE